MKLTVVVPCYNERENIRRVVDALDDSLSDALWEVVFVDDDSPDGTAQLVHEISQQRSDVRLIHRKGRRGLAGACIEGMLSSSNPLVAVMDADLQHDVTKLREMLTLFQNDDATDIVIGSRYVGQGKASSGFSYFREFGSRAATAATRLVLGDISTDPMSGFFMMKRARFNEVVTDLQPQGFKILSDMLASSGDRWKVAEVSYEFQARKFGDSKMNIAILLELFALLVSKLTKGLFPIRLVLYLAVGMSGVLVQLAFVKIAFILGIGSFVTAQSIGVWAAITSNFLLNNALTFRDRGLSGGAFWRGLLSYYVICAVGALINIGVAQFIYTSIPHWVFASITGAIIGASWNFVASSLFTWKSW